MYYEWEWMSDLAIIPAFEIALIFFTAGAVTIGLVWWISNWRNRK